MAALSIKSEEYELHKTGIRGWRIYLLVAFLVLLALLCIVNLIALVIMYSVLDIHTTGMASMSFMKDDEQMIKFLLETDFEYLYLDDGVLSGFSDHSVELHGDVQNISLLAGLASNSKLPYSEVVIGPNGTFISTGSFSFVDPVARKMILDIDPTSKSTLAGEVAGKSMKTNAVRTPRIVAESGKDLQIDAPGKIDLTGNEGLYADGMTIGIEGNNILVGVKDPRSVIVLNGGGGGTRLARNKMVDTAASSAVVTGGVERFRLCACMNDGLVFAQPIVPALPYATCATADINICSV